MKNILRGCLVAATLWMGVCLPSSAQRVSLKTNALYWLAGTPNLGAEFRLSRHITLDLEGAFNKYHVSSFQTRMISFSPEVRHWFSRRPGTGHFVGGTSLISNYRFTLSGTTHNGDAFGVGPVYGYSLPLGRHWNMEASVGAGLVYYREKKYGTSEMVSEDVNHKGFTLAPLKIGLSFVYVIK